jgi:hypothetical protein
VSMGLVMHTSNTKAELEERRGAPTLPLLRAGPRGLMVMRRSVGKECCRYLQAERALWSRRPAGDVTMVADDVRVSGKEPVVCCIIGPSAGRAAWAGASVQDPIRTWTHTLTPIPITRVHPISIYWRPVSEQCWV